MPPTNPQISTPPTSTLSTPSPTELQDTDPITAEAEKAAMSRQAVKHIYLVVATTPVSTSSGPRLGIGLRGSLPWPMVKADMNYFKRVTREGGITGADGGMNTVIMGRKTYESIPTKFRPLAGRTNVVVTRRNVGDIAKAIKEELEMKLAEKASGQNATFQLVDDDGNVDVTCSEDGVIPGLTVTIGLAPATTQHSDTTGGLYCIGGAQIYKAFLEDKELRPRLRILQTEIQKLKEGDGFECDTFWPEDLEDRQNGWIEARTTDVQDWTGIELPQGIQEKWLEDEKVGVRLRVRGWEQALT